MNDIDYLKLKLKHLEINDREDLIQQLKNFINYSLKNTNKIDNKFVYELLELLIDKRKLNDYVKEFLSYDSYSYRELGYGAYFPNSYSIDIYLANIIEEYKKDYQNYNSYYRKLLYLYQVLIVCFHEVEHANQVKLCRENNSNIETLILRNSMKYLPRKEFEMLLINKGYNAFEVSDLIEIKDNLEYDQDKYYYINPSERLANLKSSFISICSLVDYFEEYPSLKYEAYYYMFDNLYKGYNEYNNPTEIFIKKYDKMNQLELIKTKTEILTYLEKCSYGLKLNNKEKRKLKEKRDYLANKVLLYKK